MAIEITETRKNPLLKREEIVVGAKGLNFPPKRVEMRKEIAEKKGVSDDRVVIESIAHRYGSHEFICRARVYETKDDAARIELKHHINRSFGIKEKKGDEKKEAAKPEAGQGKKDAEAKGKPEGEKVKAETGGEEKKE